MVVLSNLQVSACRIVKEKYFFVWGSGLILELKKIVFIISHLLKVS